MEPKSSLNTWVQIIRLTVVLLFIGLLLFPLSMLLVDGPDETEMDSEKVTTRKAFSLNAYLDGTYQSSFEAWFSAHYPLRSGVVKNYKRMRYNVENAKPLIAWMEVLNGSLWEEDVDPTPTFIPTIIPTIIPTTDPDVTPTGEPGSDDTPTPTPTVTATPDNPYAVYLSASNIYANINLKQLMESIVEPSSGFHGNNAVYMGKSGCLFEKTYMDEYLGYTTPYTTVTEIGLKQNITELEYIQDELAKRGITMLYVISSSKASQYAAYIPDWYKKMNTAKEGYVRPIDQYRPLLANSRINYLDSSVYYEQIGLLVTFPKTGIHWNALAAGESTARLLQMYTEVSGQPIRKYKITGVQSSKTPFGFGNSEQDIYNILYGALPEYKKDSIVDEAYYKPIVEMYDTDAPVVNVLIQGGSFTSDIMTALSAYGIANVQRIYYNGMDANANIWTEGPEAWSKLLAGKQLVIFEATEQQIRSGHCTNGNWQAASGDGNIGHNAVYDSLYQYLKNHEGQY